MAIPAQKLLRANEISTIKPADDRIKNLLTGGGHWSNYEKQPPEILIGSFKNLHLPHGAGKYRTALQIIRSDDAADPCEAHYSLYLPELLIEYKEAIIMIEPINEEVPLIRHGIICMRNIRAVKTNPDTIVVVKRIPGFFE